MTFLRRAMAAAIASLFLHGYAAAQPANALEGLYMAETVVTGVEAPERLRGFAIGAEDVLIKLTGRAPLAETARGQAVIARAPELIADYSYEGRQQSADGQDAQGPREGPQFLKMRFDPEKFDAALREADLKKWAGKRPTVAVWVSIREAGSRYVLAREGAEGSIQRAALQEASKRRGIPIVLPAEGQEDVTHQNIVKRNWGILLKASQDLEASAVLYGTLEFDGNAAWNCQWVVAGDRAYAKWKMKGVTVDDALRGAIDKVAAAYAKQAENFGGSGK